VHNASLLAPEVRRRLELSLAAAAPELKGMPKRDRQLFELRCERFFQNLHDGLSPIYGRRADFEAFVQRLVAMLARHYRARPEALKLLDIERDLTPDWFQHESMLGYVFYVERFAGNLHGVLEHVDYLEELGVNYVHLMYTLRPREGENDGGYAIADYRDVDPRLGDIDDLEHVCRKLRQRGISACIDLVLNHCADDHAWARAAAQGEARYQDYFYMYQDRAVPDEFEKALPEVFPDFAPGNFTYYPAMEKWVWTTFNAYQWDLNWTNPAVFLEMVDIMLFLANKGVEVFRLDAVAFMWKRLGTDCQNQPEVHDILQALRAASRIATPAVAHKAEAIVSPDDLIHYFGTGRHYGKVSNIAYHNSLMVQFWSALASRDTRLMVHTLREFPRTPASIAWGTYIRCHDDIGWAVTEDDAAAVGLSGPAHRAFLSDYYSGQFPGSHARGAVFQHNRKTGDRRISGALASLAGLELALELGDERLVALSIERILLGNALICGFGGIPLLYMGDEIGMTNDYRYTSLPENAGDSRWLHRPYMDWEKAARRHDEGAHEGRIFAGLKRIVRARRHTPQLNSAYATDVLDVGHPHLLVLSRPHPLGELVGVYNFSEGAQDLDSGVLSARGLNQPFDQLTQAFVDVSRGRFNVPPYGRYWLI
jgi:amylosucrase